MVVRTLVKILDQLRWNDSIHLCPLTEAEIKYMKHFGGKYFSWPDIEDVKSTSSVFVIGGPHSIKPRDSSLRYCILEDCKAASLQQAYESFRKRMN